MDAASMRRPAHWAYFGRIDWGAVATWSYGFAVVAYLGLKGGGYDPLVHDQAGIAVWWILVVAVVAGAIPRGDLGVLTWAALALLTAFAVWTALSLTWTESVDKTWADLARLLGYLGLFGLAVLLRGPGRARLLVAGVATGIVCVSVVALLSRLHPAWFPEATQTARFVSDSRERLSYPLNYWNGLAALVAVGMPLVLHTAADARSILLRALAAAALPAMALTAFLTLSRGGIGALAVALAVYLIFTPDRLPRLLTLLVAGAAAAVLVAAAASREAFQHALPGHAAERQGDQMLLLVLIACLLVGAVQAALSLGLQRGLRPRWTLFSRRQAAAVGIGTLLAILVVGLAVNAPGRASDAWSEFKQGGEPGGGTSRLTSVAGESRYELWQSALDQYADEPLRGTGSGTFEYWWARNGGGEVVRDTHSLYLQVLGELGIVGLLLLGAFLLVVLVGGARAALIAPFRARSRLAAALAACVGFCVTALFDWTWQIPVLPAALLLLASTLLAVRSDDSPEHAKPFAPWLRVACAIAAIMAIAAIAVPLASTTLVRKSEADVRGGELSAALADARSAQNVEPGAAGPRLQRALVLEALGDLPAAAEAARGAADRESTNWRNWLVLSRIEAERGRAAAAVAAYRRARSLNPYNSLFDR